MFRMGDEGYEVDDGGLVTSEKGLRHGLGRGRCGGLKGLLYGEEDGLGRSVMSTPTRDATGDEDPMEISVIGTETWDWLVMKAEAYGFSGDLLVEYGVSVVSDPWCGNEKVENRNFGEDEVEVALSADSDFDRGAAAPLVEAGCSRSWVR
ncbi:uncharacterized protein HKW66_Vig0147330 [Vigna angularis]|uniref:Uncharacterized protein n=1 Tax=Phaseolus angularis TaxID=3914 RepID=A0A8T0JYX9_PHAAN|nr:uncharacterized protein HKW66_Vig0147330 [Vigna angularis]